MKKCKINKNDMDDNININKTHNDIDTDNDDDNSTSTSISTTSATMNTSYTKSEHGRGQKKKLKNQKKRKHSQQSDQSKLSNKKRIENHIEFLKNGYKTSIRFQSLKENLHTIKQKLKNYEFSSEDINDLRRLKEQRDMLKNEISNFENGVYLKMFEEELKSSGSLDLINEQDPLNLRIDDINIIDMDTDLPDDYDHNSIDRSENSNNNNNNKNESVLNWKIGKRDIQKKYDYGSDKNNNNNSSIDYLSQDHYKNNKKNIELIRTKKINDTLFMDEDQNEDQNEEVDDNKVSPPLSSSFSLNFLGYDLKDIDINKNDNHNEIEVKEKKDINNNDDNNDQLFNSPNELFKYINYDDNCHSSYYNNSHPRSNSLSLSSSLSIPPLSNNYLDVQGYTAIENFIQFDPNMANKQICSTCQVPFEQDEETGTLICEQCSCIMPYIDTSNNSGQSMYAPKPHNHFLKHIQQFDIFLKKFDPTTWILIEDDVLKEITDHVNMYNRTGRVREFISSAEIDSILRKKHKSELYSYVIQIFSQLNNIHVPQMTKEIKQKFQQILKKLEIPWDNHRGTRTKFFVPAFLFKKLCRILKHSEFIPFIDIVKSTKNSFAQEVIWERICKELNFDYVRDCHEVKNK
jgi:hypothetical protein